MHKIQCAKCAYTIEVPEFSTSHIDQFAEMHNCDSTKLQQAIQRVRELHKQNGIKCNSCGDDRGDYALYPCPTIKALDGEQ